MRENLWRAVKLLLPLFILGYLIKITLQWLESIWTHLLLSYFSFFVQGDYARLLRITTSVLLTFISLLIIGQLLKLQWFVKSVSFLVRFVPILNQLWTEDQGKTHSYPVLFQYPMEGQWKLGYCTGIQVMDDGKKFYRIAFVTGVGDHSFIDKIRTDLLIPLKNPVLELSRFITSFMTTGPDMLRRSHATDVNADPSTEAVR